MFKRTIRMKDNNNNNNDNITNLREKTSEISRFSGNNDQETVRRQGRCVLRVRLQRTTR